MDPKVYFTDMRTDHKANLFDKISRLLDYCAIRKRIATNDLVAVKVHFGEKGNHAFVRPVFVRRVVEDIKNCGGRPFLTDSSTLYPGERKEAVSALTNAIENGFAYAVVGAPLIMCDGLRGHTAVDVPVEGEFFRTVQIGAEIVEIRLSFKIDDAFSALLISFLHPFKGVIRIVKASIDYGDATRSDLISFRTLFQFINYFLCRVYVARHRIGVAEPD